MPTRLRGSTFLLSLLWKFLFHHNVDAFQGPTVTQQVKDVDLNGVRRQFTAFKSPTLKLVSESPLLFTSTEPLLNQLECEALSDFFQGYNQQEGEHTLRALQDKLDQLIGRDAREGRVEPRFLQYEPTLTGTASTVEDLLPDGLHVDTNNGKLLRYLTVLVYLTSSQSSATTFPLATSRNEEPPGLLAEAQALLQDNLHHTGGTIHNPSVDRLHQAAMNVYLSNDDPYSIIGGIGKRILPKQGHLLSFWNIDPSSGAADPFSWHGAEALRFGDRKEVLTFFYEIPRERIWDQESFGLEVGRRKEASLRQFASQQNTNNCICSLV